MDETDGQYVQCCLDGDPAVFRHLVKRYQVPLVSYLARRLGDEEEAGEVAQEAFVRAYFALRDLRKPDSFFPWLVGIAGRVEKECRRAARRRGLVILRSCDVPAEPPREADPEADAAVTEAVGQLPNGYREVILLRYYGGLSCAEVGSRLGMPPGTVTKTLSRAYALLRKSLGKRLRPENTEVPS